MSNEGLYTSGSTAVSAKVDSIPLRDTDVTVPGQQSIGTLISNASEQVSTLVRGEIELAKAEVVGEVKKGAVGGGLFAVAGVIALYSTFFLFFALAEMLAFLGFKKLKNIKAPEKTIESVNELKNLKPGQAQKNLAKDEAGLYTSTGTGATVPRAGSTAVTR